MAARRRSTRKARALGVERLAFGAEVAFAPAEELLDGVTVAPLTGSIFRSAPFQAAVFRLGPAGRIGRHPATVPQILAVLDGSGEVSGADGIFEPIGPGEAVFWPQGEEHETSSATGLTALILEGAGLEPYRRR
jgi:quercetin dioxygenase-like cupin family protein